MDCKTDLTNPWSVQSIFELQYFNCQSCSFKHRSKQSFVDHAYAEHSESTYHLANINDGSLDDINCPWKVSIDIKEEILEEEILEKEILDEEDPFANTSVKNEESEFQVKQKIVYTQEGPAFCNKCSKSFPNNRQLISHISEEHGIGRIKCALCILTFETMPELERHFEDTHSQQNPKLIKCKFCDEAFVNYSKLARHKELVHSILPKRNRGAKCNDCFMPISSFESEELHEEKCQILQQKICDFCGLQFSDLAELKQHRNQLHIEHFDCDVCHKQFRRENLLNQHKKKVHATTKEIQNNDNGHEALNNEGGPGTIHSNDPSEIQITPQKSRKRKQNQIPRVEFEESEKVLNSNEENSQDLITSVGERKVKCIK